MHQKSALRKSLGGQGKKRRNMPSSPPPKPTQNSSNKTAQTEPRTLTNQSVTAAQPKMNPLDTAFDLLDTVEQAHELFEASAPLVDADLATEIRSAASVLAGIEDRLSRRIRHTYGV